ncbi:hypothetical protein C8Q76DRAFT_804200 [Earliella scabrosa]|nr:hypothetical protein C8Q76DRAFT_804200 [Earliella scabrosa]
MPTGSNVCQGCGEEYPAAGYYLRHLRTTTHPACIAWRAEVLQYRENSESGSSSHDEDDDARPASSTHPSDLPDEEARSPSPVPQAFQGDCLGTYDDDYWNNFDDYNGPVEEEEDQPDVAQDEEDEDEEDWMDGDGSGWEPPQRALTPEPEGADNEGPISAQDTPDREADRRTHRHLHTRTHVVQYPGGLAGAPIDKEPSASSSYEAFEAAADASGTNPYAPFVSKMDWEVARWAKMRGPGSTALTELLRIEELPSL